MKNEQYGLFKFLSQEEFAKVRKFAGQEKTPFLLINLNRIEKRYDELRENLPYAKVYYAVKANPNNEVIKALFAKGSNFDVATVYEMNQLLELGIAPERMSYGNTIKKERDIAYAYSKGIRLFATDSEDDLKKIARQASGSKVFFRLLCDSGGADWPLSRKFGAHPDVIYNLAIMAEKLGLESYGLSFHVGSQQRDVGQWDNAIAQCRYMFDSLAEKGIYLKMINIGGGLPSDYVQPTNTINEYAREITRFLKEDFGENLPEVIIEPGRSISADSGVIVSEVVMVSQKSRQNRYSWLYLDIGKFGGLIETIDECIKYPIFTESSTRPDFNSNDMREYIIAGPTCDSMDILYENKKYKLDKDIKDGDKIYILTTGAYTSSYSSIYFNGFPPLKVIIDRF
ncbi:ornithine decarboxylase [Candidatus Falkowbacteria bacterium RIFOXYB2_FULL_34_18]|uniref:ornithine decarboxylase n=1 Tax=Candidatus Falkowbacteria bacterium RIFOXYD2_FULL_34_120 TaxID=1798007 RepID=A0A1F5TN81_9BACT|nr:MAG: ornithine decarboxylase [Candidatus Falkowbacteria bacterium RIFOXYB2_FULL_34_18]OGF29195.1 MAG: ornithine decarboxylase [Candidatus Falkowbacteria bacterium RIFOXYC12_FULL_34_55]OGF37733.1 MAG: ornithine decarboxylase [Candidatus Falkowbacteria bacterium RIFOXYC2_FULL_34_220]OGF38717.1 MAG: ornithine decarboxylase [Candidatus Falkowbacteria bacterium RIFOXYD12_FULL_34_57]OGF39951.1 MAG: ornithine decarboxylase [Candidatus Falkowbacteria bacterium RIFOXYD2_FULL_34_120]